VPVEHATLVGLVQAAGRRVSTVHKLATNNDFAIDGVYINDFAGECGIL
jgi:aerobic-type carbon monoxide dehydrogenase small subunit (CoxS/CutS family)